MRSLLVASAGGHLEELWMLRPRMAGLADEVVWVTWENDFTRSLLQGEDTIFVRGTRPRDLVGAAVNLADAQRILARGRWRCVVSTGALVGLPFLAVARAHGIEAHFIESTARVDEPSMTGRLLERLGGVHRYSQYRGCYPDRRRPGWMHRGSVFDSFTPGPPRTGPVRSMVVTVGTNHFGFRRMVERLVAVVPPGVEVTWQTGATDASGLGIEARVLVPASELSAAMARADLVVAHAGAGSAISAMRAGHRPVLVPRRSSRGEHVDDHQAQIAAELGRQGLATPLEVEDLTWESLVSAGQQVSQPLSPPEFTLAGAAPPHVLRPVPPAPLAGRRQQLSSGRQGSRAAS